MSAAAPIVLWGAGTSRSLRPLWMLHELGLDYEHRPILSRSGETREAAFTALNPRQKIPVFQQGEVVIAESAAIVTWLAECHGVEAGLIPPPGTHERGFYYQWCFWVMTELDAHTLYVIRRHGDLADLYGEAPNAIQAAREYFSWQLGAAEQALAEDDYLLGEHFTAADLLLTTCLDWGRMVGIELPERVVALRDRCAARPAYQAAMEVNFAPLRALADG